MWFKIELDKSGAILSCEQVAQGFNGTKYVRYIEAETKAKACSSAKDWWGLQLRRCRESKARLRTRRLAEGRCRECESPRAAGLVHCARHAAQNRKQQAKLRSEGPVAREPADPADRYAVGKQRALKVSRILREFDSRGPELFRAWIAAMVAEDAEKTARVTPSAEAAE